MPMQLLLLRMCAAYRIRGGVKHRQRKLTETCLSPAVRACSSSYPSLVISFSCASRNLCASCSCKKLSKQLSIWHCDKMEVKPKPQKTQSIRCFCICTLYTISALHANLQHSAGCAWGSFEFLPWLLRLSLETENVLYFWATLPSS